MGIILAANPHRVFISRVGRAEVFQPIPPLGGRSPDGPHTHFLPRLLAHGGTHAATEPLPNGWVPCAHLYPAHPLRDQLGRKREFRPQYQAAFKALLERYGEPESVALIREVVADVMARATPGCAGLSERSRRPRDCSGPSGRSCNRSAVLDAGGVARGV